MLGTSRNQIMTACVSCMVVMMACAVAIGSTNFPRITKNDFNSHIEQLSLDSEQKKKADVIFENYQKDLQATLDVRKQMLRWIWLSYPEEYGGYAPGLKAELNEDERTVEATIQLGLRQLERNYFKKLAGLDDNLIELVESLRRSQLRQRLLQKNTLPDTTPAGVAFDVFKLVQKIVPDWRNRPELAENLASYEELMDPLLIRLDDMLWKYDLVGNEGLHELKYKLGRGEIPPDELDWQISHVADFFVEIHYLLVQIRSLNNSATHAVASQLSDHDARQFQAQARQYLARYMYDSSDFLPDVIIPRALSLTDINNTQQETLSNIRTSYLNKESVTKAGLEPLFEQMLTRQMYRLSFEAWVRRIVLKETIKDPREHLRQEFRGKVDKWKVLQEQFIDQLKAVLTDRQWQQIQ